MSIGNSPLLSLYSNQYNRQHLQCIIVQVIEYTEQRKKVDKQV